MLSFLTKLLRQTRKDYPRGACGGFEARGPSWSRGIFGGSLDFGYLGWGHSVENTGREVC